MKRFSAVITVLLILAALTFVPAFVASAASAPVTISYFTFSANPDHLNDIDAMRKAFEAQHPDIKIRVETAAWDAYWTKLQTLVAGGAVQDSFELNYENFVSYADRGALLNLTPLISADKSFNAKRYNQQAYKAFSRDGKQYGLVESFSNVVLFYNKDLFDKAGVPYPSADWTWKDELAAAKKLTDAKKDIWGTYSPIQFWEFYKTVAQNGGALVTNGKLTLNRPENVGALEWMIDKVNKYKVTPNDAQMAGRENGDMFKTGNIAMLRTGIWWFAAFKDAPFEWDIALEPGNTSKAHHFFANGLAVSSKSKHPKEAYEWIKFLSSGTEALKIRIQSGWELPAVTDKELLASYLKQSPPKSRDVVFEALDTLVVPPVIERWGEFTDVVGRYLDLARLGKLTPKEALDQAQKAAEPLFK